MSFINALYTKCKKGDTFRSGNQALKQTCKPYGFPENTALFKTKAMPQLNSCISFLLVFFKTVVSEFQVSTPGSLF